MRTLVGGRSRRTLRAALLLSALLVPAASALDEESCLLCHQFDSLAYSTEPSGEVYHFEVDPNLWAQSVHGKVACRDCHRDVTTLPHGPVAEVDCGVTCHVIDPSSSRPFSHTREIDRFRNSVHGQGAEQDPYAEDRPDCLTCHTDRLFASFEGAWGATDAMVQETLTRCRGCHQGEGWSEYVLMHVMHRMRRRRPQEEVVQLCTSCHEDAEKMARHGLIPMWSFRDSQHWRMILLGDPNAPDCLSCHVPVGFSAHEIHRTDDLKSAINVHNLQRTCGNAGGAQQCHAGATEAFSQTRIHFTDRQMGEVLEDPRVDPEVRQLLAQRIATTTAFTRSDILRFRILDLITLFYKFMIGGTIGFMVVHQILDLFAHRRRHRRPHAPPPPPPEPPAVEPPTPPLPAQENA